MKAQVITKTAIDKTVIGDNPCYRRRETGLPVYNSKKNIFAYTTTTYQCNYEVIGQDENEDNILGLVDIGKPIHISTISVTPTQLNAFSASLTYPGGQSWTERAKWEIEQILLLDTTTEFIKNPNNPICQLGEPSDWEVKTN